MRIEEECEVSYRVNIKVNEEFEYVYRTDRLESLVNFLEQIESGYTKED